MVGGSGRALAVALAISMLLPALMMMPSVPAAGTGSKVIFTEDFEHAWPGLLPNGWDRGDDNNASDIDYWCRSTYERVSPTHAAWCAQIGYNSLFQNALNKNITMLEDPNVTYKPKDYTLRYDVNMDGYMRHPLIGIDSFSTVTVTFRYWAMTGNSTYSLGTDYLWVGATSSSETWPGYKDQVALWRQPADNSSGWQVATVNVPTSSTWLVFNFHSGPVVQEGGPFIGVFIDDIVVEGQGDEAPVSKAIPAVNATNQDAVDVSVDMVEHGGALEYLELYYRINGTGDFARYAPTENPSGRWTGQTVVFRASSDGRYDLFSIATDRWGNTEAMKSEADASVYVDHGPPSSLASVSGRWGNMGWFVSAGQVNITAWDVCGISSITFRLDGGAWIEYDGPFEVAGEGKHVLQYYSMDRASNTEEVRSLEVWVDREGPSIRFEGTDDLHYGESDPTMRFAVGDSASGIELVQASIDGGPYQEVSHHAYFVSLSGLSQGGHVVSVKAWDYAGNQASAVMNVTLDGAAVGGDTTPIVVPLVVMAFAVMAIVLMINLSRRRG